MILHIDPEKVWQGGQRQVVYLVERLNIAGVASIIACSSKSPLEKYCRENDIPFAAFNFHYRVNPAVIYKIVKLCRKNKVRLIHCHSSYALTLGLQVKFLMPHLKLVASRRVDFHIKSKMSGFIKYKNSMLDRLVCISRNIMEICKSDGIPENKLQLIHSGIELERLSIQLPPADFIKGEHFPEHNIIIGTIAALVGHKDYPTLIKAAQIVLMKYPAALFLALGRGPERKKLEAMTTELGISERFRFLGFREEVGWFLNSFDIFILASKYEGLGTSVLDALACGRACVCTDGGGIPEMIKNNENGLLVPAQQPEKLAAAVSRLIENPAERAGFSANARQSVEKFSVDNTVREHIILYQELLDERI
ncbi:MAG: glycosyltransferase family 4 protein [Candidatus Cloacimonetes bacterium]|nr:glycosyltransferase family 4 protein [Candidatus Cloacimonadota bacterium]